MQLSYETQGASSFLVYTAENDEKLDTLILGMITNNKITGFAPAVYTQLNDTGYVKYNVSSRVSADQIFGTVVNKKQLLGVFLGIVEALIHAEEYMIPTDNIILDLKHIYVEVSTYNSIVICIPQLGYKNEVSLNMFLKNILFNTRFDEKEDSDYVARIINFLNKSENIVLTEFKELILSLKKDVNSDSASSVNNVYPQEQIPIISQEQRPPVQQVDMQNQWQQIQQGVQPQGKGDNVELGIKQTPPQMKTPPMPDYNMRGQNIKNQGQVFNIPGQGQRTVQDTRLGQGQRPLQGTQPEQNMGAQSGEKKMSLGYLLMHYSAENKEKYKAQKESAATTETQQKKKKKKKGGDDEGMEMPPQTPIQPYIQGQPGGVQSQRPPQPYTPPQSTGTGSQGIPPQPIAQTVVTDQQVMPSTGMGSQGISPQPPYTPQSFVQQVNPQVVSPLQRQVQNQPANFGETTILSQNNNAGTQTTIISNNAQYKPMPFLIRKRTNQKIDINKDVFKIGKQNSYVDYFIPDNAAISRSHASIITRDNRYYIIDTNSTNHTYIEGQMISPNQEFEIKGGQIIRLANEDFEFHVG